MLRATPFVLATAVAAVIFLPSTDALAASTSSAKRALTARAATMAAHGAIRGQLGGAGGARKLACKRSSARSYSCRGSGMMRGGGGSAASHAFSVTAKVRLVCGRSGRCSTKVEVRFGHAPPATKPAPVETLDPHAGHHH